MSGPLRLGAEPKKVMALGGLLLVAAGIYFFGPSGGDTPKGSSKPASPPAPSVRKIIEPPQQPEEADPVPTKGGRAVAGKTASHDFKPTMKRRPGETADPEKADPTLRTDLLAKLARVRMDHVDRSLFDFSSAAPPAVKLPEPKIVVKQVKRMIGPVPPPPAPPPLAAQEKPPPPPIPLKFFGRALPLPNGARRVFCMLNDEVNVSAEGDVIQHRYKIQHITATNVVVEDLSFSNQQTLPIEEPATQGGF